MIRRGRIGAVRRGLTGVLAALTAVTVPVLSACHVYVPTELRAVPVGEEVRLYLSRAAAASLPEEVTVNGALYLGGRLESQAADTVVLGVRMPRDVGVVSQELRQMVKVGTGQIVDVRRQEFSTPRTALLVGAGALGAALIINMIFGSEDSQAVADPDEDLSRVPTLTIPFKLPGIGW
jgi:hypothetical protein